MRDCNHLYRETPALFEGDCRPEGFRWVKHDDELWSVLTFLRLSRTGSPVLAVFNWTSIPRLGYQMGGPEGGPWDERLNSDTAVYQGGGMGNLGTVMALMEPYQGFPYSLTLTLPPLSMIVLQPAIEA